jgi:hypothetical protein
VSLKKKNTFSVNKQAYPKQWNNRDIHKYIHIEETSSQKAQVLATKVVSQLSVSVTEFEMKLTFFK